MPEIYREVEAINRNREFVASMAAQAANHAGQSLFKEGQQATVDKFLGRDRSKSKKGWAQKAYMYFDMASRTPEENGGS